MASTVGNSEEREKRILEVGKYFEDTGKSTREISDYFSINHFKISNKTVSVYINEYMKIHPEKQLQIKQMIDHNTEKTITDKDVRERVFRTSLLSIDGFTFNEIAEMLKISNRTVERDLTVRLPLLAKGNKELEKIYHQVKESLKQHQVAELSKGRKKW